MPRILTVCPTTSARVATGHRTQDIDLSLMTEPRSFRCPSCGSVHAWSRDDAVIEEGLTLAATRTQAQV